MTSCIPAALILILVLVPALAPIARAGSAVPGPALSPGRVRVPDLPERAPAQTAPSLADIPYGQLPEPPVPENPGTTPGNGYLIGTGDILTVSVWQNPELTRQVAVLPDGTINLPLIGTLRARDVSVETLTATIRSGLGKYVFEPVLTVSVDQVNSMAVYIIGNVSRSGRFAIHKAVDVLQAISLAGGVTPFADKDEIRIFRKTPDRTRIFSFDYGEVTRGKHLEQNIFLERGDVIVVP